MTIELHKEYISDLLKSSNHSIEEAVIWQNDLISSKSLLVGTFSKMIDNRKYYKEVRVEFPDEGESREDILKKEVISFLLEPI